MRWRGFAAISGLMILAVCALATPEGKLAPPPPALRLTVRVQHLFDGAPLRFDTVSLTNSAGNRLSISRLAYLLSNFILLRSDGAQVRLAEQAAYLNPATGRNAFTFAAVPVGGYVGISFRVGLSPQANHADPSRYPAGHSLNPTVNNLHWGWQGGYVFFALEGRYTRADGRLGGYSYHLATDRDPMTVTLMRDFQLEQDSALDLKLDVARVFDAVNKIILQPAGGNDSTHSAPTDTLATQIKANVAQSFAFAELSPVATAVARHPTPNTPHPTPKITSYPFHVPPGFPQPLFPADNPLTVPGVALGKRLFFEKRLSANNTQSCANCHRPERAFADGGHAVSVGIDGKRGTRHAMSLVNLAWNSAFTWDGRRSRLRDQALAPIQDAKEMHQSLARTVTKLRADRRYPALFARAFGSPGITPERIGLAIEQYLYTLVSADSKFDRALRGAAQFTEQEKRGLMLFITEYDPARGQMGADCFHCHGGNLFTDNQFKNNGLEATFKDPGRALITHRDADRGKFKTPTLRNVELTGPYMHDGRFVTLDAVIEHYTTGIQRSDTLDPNIAKHPDDGMQLSKADKQALVAFLKTLTDERYKKRHDRPR